MRPRALCEANVKGPGPGGPLPPYANPRLKFRSGGGCPGFLASSRLRPLDIKSMFQAWKPPAAVKISDGFPPRPFRQEPFIELGFTEAQLTPDLETRKPLMLHPEIKRLMRNLQIPLGLFFREKRIDVHCPHDTGG